MLDGHPSGATPIGIGDNSYEPLVKRGDFTSAKKNPLDIVWRIQFFHQDFPLFLFSGLFPAI